MTLEILKQDFEDLSDDEKLDVADNGYGKEYASYLRVLHDGNDIGLFSDAMEPEDARFSRDLRWIESMIRTAYELGQIDSADR